MEGKRPTRQRTSKEETKQGGGNTSLTPQPSGLGRAVSSSGPSAPTGVMKNLSTSQAVSQPRREPAGLLRSKSENPLQSKQQQSSSKHHHTTEDRHKHNKRKHKLKSKMKYVKEDSSASASVKDLGMNLHSLEEHKLSGPQKPHLLSSSLDSRNPSSLSAALQKLRERDSTRNNNHPQPFKKKKENSSERVGTTAALEEAIRREMAMAAKFEMVEVHPLYAVNRYACSVIGQVMHENMKVTFHQVNNVNPENFNVKLSSDPQKDLKYDDCVFLSKPFKLNYNDLSPSSKSHLSTHLGETFQQDINTNILVSTQVPFSHCSGPVPLVAFLPTRNEYLIANLSAEANPIDALKELEEEDFKEEDYKMAYGRHTEEVIQKALKIFQAYNQYMNTTSKVNISKDNLEDALFTIVNYQTQDNISGTPTNNIAQEESKTKTTKSGVFLRAKLDLSFYQEHLLFVRKLGGSYKQGKHGLSIGSHKEVRSEWLQFSKHRIQSDISKGFISINCLSSVNSDSSSRLRKRNLVFVSYRESLQQRKSIRQIANETIENSEVDRKAPLFKDSSMRPGDRCVLCNYQAQGYEHLRCSCCNKVYHEECIKREPKRLHQLYLGIRELNWRCHDCIRCVNCLSIGGKSQSQQLLNCKCCNSAYHFDCLDPNVKMSMPSIQPETSITNKNSSQANQSLPDIYFHCERCVQCDQCGAREAGKNRLNKWSKDFKLCSNCNKKRKKNQLCTVCESFWPDDILSEPANPEIQAQNPIVDTSQTNRKINEYLNTKMINCGKCGIWVHYECDRIFEDEGIKKMFLNSKNGIPNDMNYGNSLANETLIYHCIDCKQQQRSNLIRQIIENLANEDKQFYFQEPVEDLIHNYSKIIKTPMCFKYVKDRAKGLSSNHYLTDPSQLRKDISLIFDNAMKFNLPKHKVHKEAQRLGQVCTAVLDSIWTRLELNAQRTLDENKHKEWLRKQRRDNLRATLEETGQKLLRVKDEPFQAQRAFYSLKLEELFDQSEYQPGSNEQVGDTGGLMMTSQDAIRRYGGDGFEEDEDMNSQEDDDEDLEENEYDEELESEGVPGSDREFYAQKRSKQKGTGNNHKKRDLRTRKNVDYNEEKAEILGKRGYVGGNDEGQHRIGNSQYSSKKARYQQQSAQYASQLSFNSIKGASLLQQALHQQEKQMQSQHIEGNQGSQNLSTLQQHASADQAKNTQQEYQAQIIKLQEIDDERCYYSNPARCSFDDPCLVFEEMCYLCGSFGKRKDFLSCTLCGESFHTYCLQLLPANSNEDNDDSSPVMLTEEEEQALIAKFQPYWKCLNCKFCDICSSATQEAFLLYCDVCDKAFHSFCWTPQLKLIPKCQWKCSECFKCTKCGTHRFFDPALHFKPGSNLLLEHIIQSCQNDFEFSQNFSLCYECGMNEHKKSFCKICQSTHIQLGNSANLEDGAAGGAQQQQVLFVPQLNNMGRKKDGGQKNAQKQNEKMLKCKSCGYYCHVKCSRLLPQIEEDSEEQQDEFKCLECLLTGKSINHLIRESCEHYENMHQIINRHRLLSYLLSEILTPYFPQQEKAPLFIKAFIEQNKDLFKKDPVIIDWLSLLETGVVYNQPGGQLENEESTNNATADHLMRVDSKETFQTSKKLEEADLQAFAINEIYQSATTLDTIQKTPAQESYQKMFGHKESFLPAKRNLYDALASDEGHHRFGQRNHFMDPFSEETQSLITLPVQENLEKDVNFARLYVEYELKAVMKVKLNFFDWFEEMLRGIVERCNNRQNKKKSVIVSKQEDSQSLQAIDQSHENATLQSFIMGVQDPPSSNIGERVNHQHNHHQANNANEMCFDEDILIDNPQKRLQCVMCKLKGELKVTGRLIPFQVNQFVHVNCALWSTDVHEIAEGGYLINFFQIWNTRAKFQKCNQCGENGASLFCSSSRTRCQVAYHFPCAYRNKKMAFAPRDVKETICDLCCKFTRGVHPGLPLEHANTKRRFQIAKNQQPWNMTHHMTNLALQTQSLQQALFNSGTTSAADIEKPLQIEKWRPFFFDMFNRVGNMTILSLRKEINQIIEEYCTQTRSSANSEQNLKDFSTVRIYWRHFELDKEEVMPKDQQSVGTDVEMIDTSKSQWGKESKGFYLYSNNQIKELVYRDLEALLPYVCFRVKDKVDLGLHYSSLNPTKLQQVAHQREQNFQGFISASTFWQKLLNHYTMERARFSLNNIIFSLSEFTGKTKYPVSIWNRCPEGMKNKAFFLRAGEQVLGSQHPLGITHAQGVGQDKDQVREASFSGQITNGGASSVQGFGNIRKVDPFKATNIDDIFKRMTKINQMGEHQNPMASIKRVNASKHLPYEAVLHNLGKKMFYKAPPQNSSLFEDANLSGLKPQKGQNQQQQQESGPAKPKGLQKKARQADTVGSGQGGQGVAGGEVNAKESDLPIAMKYRLSKTQPKTVEVGPSKIHRNGLFTLEDLSANDIVIEYVGERIRNKVADKRELVYEQKGIGDCYLFRLDKEYIIDATFHGNKARYLNHSCDANCSAKIINVQQQKHIIICANRQIKSGEELTYNYNFDYEADKIECFCGAPGCLGRLN